MRFWVYDGVVALHTTRSALRPTAGLPIQRKLKGRNDRSGSGSTIAVKRPGGLGTPDSDQIHCRTGPLSCSAAFFSSVFQQRTYPKHTLSLIVLVRPVSIVAQSDESELIFLPDHG